MYNLILGLLLTIFPVDINSFGKVQTNNQTTAGILTVKKCTDFEVTGKGTDQNWSKTEWLVLPQRSGELLTTKVKLLYSETGIYFLFDCRGNKINSSMTSDFMDLWKEDVVEVFLWPDESIPFYFEYELTPLNFELPLLISNDKGTLLRWQPFHYDPDRKTHHETDIQGGEKKNGATVTGWTMEFFVPYKLLSPLKNVPPVSGSKWRANLYRVQSGGNRAIWSWQLTSRSFHDYAKYGILLFE